MRRIRGRLAQDHNHRQRSLGSLWQERYKARIVDTQAYLGHVLAYVHLNPVTARLVTTPGAWRWSGHRELLTATRAPLVDVDKAWLLLGETLGQAR
jgi:putative transposase